MKMYKVEFYIIDMEDFGLVDYIINCSQSNDYYLTIPNFVKATDIGEWSDDHPLNKLDISKEEIEKYFIKKRSS